MKKYIKLYSKEGQLLGFQEYGGGESAPTITPALPVTLNRAAGNVEFTISPVTSMPSSLVIIDDSSNEDELIGKTADADVFNGAAALITPVAFANNSVTFTLAYNHAESVFASFRLG